MGRNGREKIGANGANEIPPVITAFLRLNKHIFCVTFDCSAGNAVETQRGRRENVGFRIFLPFYRYGLFVVLIEVIFLDGKEY